MPVVELSDTTSKGFLGEEVVEDAAEQGEVEDDPALVDRLGAFADAAVGDLDKETLKMRIKSFMRVRMAQQKSPARGPKNYNKTHF